MTGKRYELVKDYDCDGNWEYAYQNNDTGRRYNFADENCDYDFLNDVNSTYEKLKKEIEQLKQDDLIFFQQVFHILLKYQHLFNREMADEVLDELGIELTDWFE